MSDPSRLDRPSLPTPERIQEIRKFWIDEDGRLFDWSLHGSAANGVRAVKTIRDLLAALDAATAERDEAQRAKYGTPCRCESWIAACGEAESARDVALARAEALEAELSRLRALTTWQPIETHDGSSAEVMLWWPYWSLRPTVGYLKHGQWIAENALDDNYAANPKPTHWQPLPAPPAEDRAKEGR